MQAKPSTNAFPNLNSVAKPKNVSCSREPEPCCFRESQAEPSPGKHSSTGRGTNRDRLCMLPLCSDINLLSHRDPCRPPLRGVPKPLANGLTH